MRKLFSVAVMAAGLSLAAASSAQAPTGSAVSNDFCYLECQYRCFVTNPGGGPDWTQCYLACAREKCGWDG